jgi:phage terminase large subunit
VVRANWSDNPWLPAELQQERLDALRIDPDNYAHVWEGDYARILVGAYFAKQLQEARAQGRIGVVSPDPLLTTRAYWDIGGTGARADATAIWVVQFVGSQVRVLNYYEAVGQPLEAHVNWLRDNGYQRAECVLPHDGANAEKVYSISYESALQAAGFSTRVIPNMGAGAASKRIEAVRRVFPACWFHETTTDPGREALGYYHEKRDEARGIGLGPNHDWSSHAADGFGLMAVDFLSNSHMPTSGTRRSAPRLGVA